MVKDLKDDVTLESAFKHLQKVIELINNENDHEVYDQLKMAQRFLKHLNLFEIEADCVRLLSQIDKLFKRNVAVDYNHVKRRIEIMIVSFEKILVIQCIKDQL